MTLHGLPTVLDGDLSLSNGIAANLMKQLDMVHVEVDLATRYGVSQGTAGYSATSCALGKLPGDANKGLQWLKRPLKLENLLGFKAGTAVFVVDTAKAYVPATAARLAGAGENTVAALAITSMLAHITVVKGRGAACALGGCFAVDPAMMAIGCAPLVGGAVVRVMPRRKAPSPPVPVTWIGRNIASCTGCRLCEVACSLTKEQKIQPGISRISVRQYYPGVEFPVACYQCGDEAKCVEACPVSALAVDTSKKLNTISIDTTRCTRTAQNSVCTLCLDQCPGLVVNFHPTTKAPLICDLCGGDPECVKVCPSTTIMNKGVKMAAIQPMQIAAGLAEMYKVPEANKAPAPQMGPPPGAAAPGAAGRGGPGQGGRT